MANTELFKKIRDQIKRDPQSFDMKNWGFSPAEAAEEEGDWDHDYYDVNTRQVETIPASECGTTRCVAGWAVHFEAERLGINVNQPLIYVMRDLADQLDLPPTYAEVAGAVLQINDTNLFWTDAEDAYGIVNEYAEGLRN